uniref:Uncharacterized protein n=1 Tax=Arundo donax TaxID=35708 RepID=A0A0A9AI48_ARUDO
MKGRRQGYFRTYQMALTGKEMYDGMDEGELEVLWYRWKEEFFDGIIGYQPKFDGTDKISCISSDYVMAAKETNLSEQDKEILPIVVMFSNHLICNDFT